MNKNTITAVIIGLIIGATGALGVTAATDENDPPKTASTTTSADHSSMSMTEMSAQLKGKTGDDFDKTFLAEMISHHEGALEMAKLAQTNAMHDEIKTLAGDIIGAQTSEISQMQSWQTQWNYLSSSSSDSMSGMNH